MSTKTHDLGDLLDSLRQDLRFGLRNLAKHPGFTFILISTLALGIGANAAIFAVVDAVVLRPLPFDEPERLVMAWETMPGDSLPLMFASPPNYDDWRSRNESFDDLSAFRRPRLFLKHEGASVALQGAEVSASLFPVLRVEAAVGRVFSEEEDAPGAPPVAVLSDALWQGRFGADPSIVGTTIEINGETHTVVGVMAPAFDFPPAINLEGTNPADPPELWRPLRARGNLQRGAHHLNVTGRLRAGVSLERAGADMTAVAEGLADEYPDVNEGWGVTLLPLAEQLYGSVKTSLVVLMGAALFVVAIVCLNVANLLVARGMTRQRELAIRAALGAGKARLARQLLTESWLLALAGGVAGLLLARLTLGFLVALAPSNVPRIDEVAIDAGVFAFTLGLTLLVGLFFGLAPAMQATALDLSRRLRERGTGDGSGRLRMRGMLVVTEIALAVVLLTGAALLIRSFLHLRAVDPGFRAADLTTMSLTLPRAANPEGEQWASAYAQIEDRVAALPQVEGAGFVLELPLTDERGGTGLGIAGEGEPPEDEDRRVNFTVATPGFLPAMGVPLLAGRHFNPRDDADAPPVVIVNQALARRFFPDENPVGRRVTLGMSGETVREIVGVVGNVLHDKLNRAAFPAAYTPYAQHRWRVPLALAVRSSAPASELVARIRKEVGAIDHGIPVYEVRTMSGIVHQATAPQRFSTLLLGLFAATALVLAAIGIYGVIAFSVSRRTQEIGIRMALGARAGDVIRMVLGQGMTMTAVGVVLGVLGALGLTRFASSLLFQVDATDPMALVQVLVLLVAVAFCACYIPALRASTVRPTVALRDE